MDKSINIKGGRENIKVLLITDSLGSPREEVPIEDVWTYRLMKKHSWEGIIFFTIIKHGLDTSQIDFTQIKNIKPDICICQIGIVDCARRVAKKSVE